MEKRESEKKVYKNKKLSTKKGLQCPPSSVKLTKTEQEVLHLITEEFLTIKQIQLRRQCTRQAVYKIIRNLKKKGAYNLGLQKVYKSQPTCQPVNQIRLHGQEFNIKFLWQNHNYQKLIKKSNILFIDGHTIRLYRNSIEIYAGEGVSFYGEDEQRATVKSLKYWQRFFIRLEHELKVILVKPRSQNIRIVNQHYAHPNSEICENAIENKKNIRVYAEEDGKLAFITDDSFGMKEDETVHPQTAKQDRGAIDKQVNDWRLNNPPTQSELNSNQHFIFESLKIQTQNVTQTTKNLAHYAQHLRSHVKSVQDLGFGVKELVSLIKEMKGVEKN